MLSYENNAGAAFYLKPVTMLDIGAEHGSVCIPAYRAGTKYVMAVEPRDTEIASKFEEDLREGQNFRIVRTAVWNDPNGSIYMDGIQTKQAPQPEPNKETVGVLSIYDVFNLFRLDLEEHGLYEHGLEYLKIDIEGAEFNSIERTQRFKDEIDSLGVKWIDLEIHANACITKEDHPTYTPNAEPPRDEHEAVKLPHAVEMLEWLRDLGFEESDELGAMKPYPTDFKRRIFSRS